MKATLVPLYYSSAEDAEFVRQVDVLRILLADVADILPPVALGASLPPADAVVFPQMLGAAYRRLPEFKALELPILVITSEFATVSMWDWEINRYLDSEGVRVYAPYNLDQAKVICRTLALKKDLRRTKLVVFQDNPGEGFQASIFKRFYWWENECTERMVDKFGICIERRSFRDLGVQARSLPDSIAQTVWDQWRGQVPLGGISERALYSALKMYVALRDVVDADPTIQGLGINCLNESHFSDTTPCLAWNLLYRERGLIWGCEGDTVAMLTKHIVHRVLGVPVMMTNLYPFLMGQAALKHERIPNFPAVPDHSENYILAAHCGYLGVVPQPFATEWTLRPKVLAIVDDNATAIDAQLPVGDATLVKIEPSFGVVSAVESELTGYAQFENSDCLNGAVIRVADGRRLMSELASHHYILSTGHNAAELRLAAPLLGMDLAVI